MIDVEYAYSYLLDWGYEALYLDTLSDDDILDLYFEVVENE